MHAGLIFLAKTMPSDSALFFAGAWFTALIVTVILACVLWLRLNDRTYPVLRSLRRHDRGHESGGSLAGPMVSCAHGGVIFLFK